jgi:hypothetical protein
MGVGCLLYIPISFYFYLGISDCEPIVSTPIFWAVNLSCPEMKIVCGLEVVLYAAS